MTHRNLLYRFLLPIFLMPTLGYGQTAQPLPATLVSRLQALKDRLKNSLKTFFKDIKDTRTDYQLKQAHRYAKTPQEREDVARIQYHRKVWETGKATTIIATVILLNLMLYRFREHLPTFKKSDEIEVPEEQRELINQYLPEGAKLPKQKIFNVFTILGLKKEDASENTVKKAYKKLVFLHPDKHSGPDQAQYAEAFKIVKDAYDEALKRAPVSR